MDRMAELALEVRMFKNSSDIANYNAEFKIFKSAPQIVKLSLMDKSI